MRIMNRLFHFVVLALLFGAFLPVSGHGATITYQYDRINRLTSVTYGDGTRIAYAYDGAGNRLSRTLSHVVIVYKADANGDHLVDLKDAVLALKVLSGLNPALLSDYAASGSDVGGNLKIGLEEVIYVLQKLGEMR